MVSEIKRPPLWKDLYPPLRYMYIVVHCGVSSIVEYGTTISVVDWAINNLGEYSGQVMNKNKINMMSRNETKRNIAYVDDLILN
jgi:hypothetical protein